MGKLSAKAVWERRAGAASWRRGALSASRGGTAPRRGIFRYKLDSRQHHMGLGSVAADQGRGRGAIHSGLRGDD